MVRLCRWMVCLLFVWTCAPVHAQSPNGPFYGWCDQGAQRAITSGLKSTNFLQGIVPQCTVTVYLHGTPTAATIYADQSNTPLSNPFTATTTGSWTFYALTGILYDVIGSGGIPPNTYLLPTLINGGSGGGGGASLPPFSVQFAAPSGGFGSDPNITINPTAHSLSVAGNGTGVVGLCGGTSGNCVNLTVQPTTGAWNFTWPTAVPLNGSGINCLTAQNTGIPANAGVGLWQPCITYVNAAADPTAGDIGAKATHAAAGCSFACTVYIPPGQYSFTTTISLPLNTFSTFALLNDQGATLRYVGTGIAIDFPVVGAGPTAGNCRVSGGFLIGTSAATAGIHVAATNTCNIQNMTIAQFTGGAGVWIDGANSVNVDHNYITNSNVGVYLTNTFCTGTTCVPTPGGQAYTPNADHITNNTIIDNIDWGVQSLDVSTSANTGALNDTVSDNNLELNGTAGSGFGAISVGRSTNFRISGNYFEGSPEAIQMGIPGGGDGSSVRFFASQGPVIRDNYFTISSTGPYQINLLDTADALIEGNGTVVASQNSANCFINTLTNNGTNIGETGTRIGKNHVTLTGGGNYTCIAGAAAALAGAGSYTQFNPNYQVQIEYQNFDVNTSVTSESVSLQNLTAGGGCQLVPEAGNTTAINNGRSTIYAGTTYISAPVATGAITITHPSSELIALDILCYPGPLNGYGIP